MKMRLGGDQFDFLDRKWAVISLVERTAGED